MTTLLQILAATLLSSVLSIVLAGLISFKFLDRYMSKMLCISAGLLLTVAFTHLLPEHLKFMRMQPRWAGRCL